MRSRCSVNGTVTERLDDPTDPSDDGPVDEDDDDSAVVRPIAIAVDVNRPTALAPARPMR